MNPTPETGQYLVLSGIFYPDNRLLLRPSFLTDNHDLVFDELESPLIAELLDDHGRVLLRAPVPAQEFSIAHAFRPELAVSGKIPFPAGTRRIRFIRDGLIIHELEVPSAQPEVALEWVPPETVEGLHTVTWTGRHGQDHPLYYVLMYTHNGRSWRSLSLPTQETELEVDFDQLPGGRARVRVLATDGVNTAFAESSTFRVPVKPCLALILAPEDGSIVPEGERLVLQGQGIYLESGEQELERLAWASSQDGTVGRGPLVEVASLSPGEHRISLVAGRGKRKAEASVTIHVGPKAPENGAG
jgi:hypothetical protein